MIVKSMINEICIKLKDVPGIVGIVLGGSRARGTNHATSDIDIGIYYDESAGFNIEVVNKVATELDDEHRENLVTALGEWGAWVNGGAWMIVQGYHVDFIFRDIKRVSKVIDDCLDGRISTHYHAGHPHAYLNVMYMGEIAINKILFEQENQISELKVKTNPYPKQLKDALIGYFMFEASFSLMFAKDNVEKDDISYVVGNCFRTISCLNQVLFALNREYCINEKKAVKMIESFPIKPNEYKQKIDQCITLISTEPEQTRKGVNILYDLILDTEMLIK